MAGKLSYDPVPLAIQSPVFLPPWSSVSTLIALPFCIRVQERKEHKIPTWADPRHFCSPLVCSYSVTWPLLTTQKTGQCSLVLCPGEKGEGLVNIWPASGMWPLLQETRGFVFHSLVLVMTDLQGRNSWWVFIKLCVFSRRNSYTKILFFKGLKC